MEEDELDINPLFRALQTSYVDLYEKAQDGCYLICIPQKNSLIGACITQKLAETHILKPSPYFRGQYVTLHSNLKVVHYEDSSQVLKTGDGFPERCQINIITEELGYNKDCKPYKILVIEKPLDISLLPKNVSENQGETEMFTIKSNLHESHAFLSSTAELKEVLQHLDDNIDQFCANYMVLKEYLDDAVKRLSEINLQYVEMCFQNCSKKLLSSSKFRDAVNTAVESYIMSGVQRKLFPVICDRYYKDDVILLERCHQLNEVSMEQLGVRKELVCPLPSAVVELAMLDGLTTPLAKLNCLKSTFDNITASIESFIQEHQHPEITFEDTPCLTSDDLIPIYVSVIAKSKGRHLASNVFYMENFHWSVVGRERDNLSYSLVTFKAAVEYLRSTDFHTLFKMTKERKEIGIDELITATKQTSISKENEFTSVSRITGIDRMDKQLERVSKLMDKSSQEWEKSKRTQETSSIFGSQYRQRSKNILPSQDCTVQTDLKRNHLGGFLASLDDDSFGTSFGKQT